MTSIRTLGVAAVFGVLSIGSAFANNTDASIVSHRDHGAVSCEISTGSNGTTVPSLCAVPEGQSWAPIADDHVGH
jgi:hypothetical protein